MSNGNDQFANPLQSNPHAQWAPRRRIVPRRVAITSLWSALIMAARRSRRRSPPGRIGYEYLSSIVILDPHFERASYKRLTAVREEPGGDASKWAIFLPLQSELKRRGLKAQGNMKTLRLRLLQSAAWGETTE